MIACENRRAVQFHRAVVDRPHGTRTAGTPDDHRPRSAIGRHHDRVVVVGRRDVIRHQRHGLRARGGITEEHRANLPARVDQALRVAAADHSVARVGVAHAVEIHPARAGFHAQTSGATDDIACGNPIGSRSRAVAPRDDEAAVVRDGAGRHGPAVADLQRALVDVHRSRAADGTGKNDASGTRLGDHRIRPAEHGGNGQVSGRVVLVQEKLVAPADQRAVLERDAAGTDRRRDQQAALPQRGGAGRKIHRAHARDVQARRRRHRSARNGDRPHTKEVHMARSGVVAGDRKPGQLAAGLRGPR